MANYYVVGNSVDPSSVDLTGTPYEGYKVVTAGGISNPFSSNPDRMENGDQVVISGSVDTDVTLHPASGLSSGYDLHVTIEDNTNTIEVVNGGGFFNNIQPNMTVDVIGKAENVSIGDGLTEQLTVNLEHDSSIGDITGGTQADDQLIVNGGNNVKIGDVISKNGAGAGDTVTIGENSQIGEILLGNGQNTVNIGAGSQAGPITGGDDDTDTMNLTVGNGATIGDVYLGTETSLGQYGGNDTITLGDNVTAGGFWTHAGDDQIKIGANSTISGEIFTGDGNDSFITGVGTTTGALSTGDGNEAIVIAGTTETIDVGSGATNMLVTETGTVGDLVFGGENDFVQIDGKAGVIQGSGGNDTITVNGTAAQIEGNTGDDIITINGSAGHIYGGTDNDTITIAAEGSAYGITGGSGSDNITVNASLVDAAGNAGYISGDFGDEVGGGSDRIELADGVTVGDIALGRGGSGGDTLIGGNNVTIDGDITQAVSDHYSDTTLGENTTITGNVDLRGGNDTFTIGANSSVDGYLYTGTHNTADDADELTIGSNTVVGDYIATGSGGDKLTLGDNITITSGEAISLGIGWDTVAGPGTNNTTNYTVDGGTLSPDGDFVQIPYNTEAELQALQAALTNAGWVPDSDTGYWINAAGETNASFSYNGVAYEDIWKVEAVPCFARGTLIRTDRGDVAIEDLSAGDLVLTADNGLQPISWIGSKLVSAATLEQNEKLRPIRIRAGSLGKNSPRTDLVVSPQHRILVRSNIAQKMFGTNEVLVAAKQLLLVDGIDIATDMAEVEYFHMLFQQHEVVLSNGAETESLYTGPEALKSVGTQAREEIFAIFPELQDKDYEPVAARALASGRKGRALAMRHSKNRKALVAH